MEETSAIHRRRQMANTNALTTYEADLTSADRAKQKEAVRHLMAERVRNDWTWRWPPTKQGFEVNDSSDEHLSPSESGRETIDQLHNSGVLGSEPIETHNTTRLTYHEPVSMIWRERDEWLSDASDSEDATMPVVRRQSLTSPEKNNNPFRFESPAGVGETVQKKESDRKQRRKRRLGEEIVWNDGVHCFTMRRDAWTGAIKCVSRDGSPLNEDGRASSYSQGPLSSSRAVEGQSNESEISRSFKVKETEAWNYDTEIPVTPPLIPASNAMRASITPTAYNTIYDKVILQNLSPSCPINLVDITRSCVQGWKRDGEWPPKSFVSDALAGRRRRKLSMASLFGVEKTKAKEEAAKAADRDVLKTPDEQKPGPFKKFTKKLLALAKEKEKDPDLGRENGNVSNESNKSTAPANRASAG